VTGDLKVLIVNPIKAKEDKMKVRTIITVLLVTLLSFSVAFAGGETVWKMSMYEPEGAPYVTAYQAMWDKVFKKTGGELKIVIYPGGQLGGERDLLQNLQTGALEAAQHSGGILGLFEPTFLIVNLPFIFDHREHALRFVKSPAGQELMKKMEAQGIYLMHLDILGFRQPNLREKLIKKPEDFKGLKWRTMEVATQIDTMKALGAIPLPLPYPEVYNSLKMRVVDGWMNDALAFKTLSIYEVAPYFTELPLFASTQCLSFSKKAFDALSEKNQKILREIVGEGVESVLTVAWNHNDQVLQDLKKTKFKEWNKITDTGPYREKVKNLYDDLVKKIPASKKYIDSINAVR